MKRVVSLFLLAVLLAVSGFLLAPSAFPTVFAQRDRDPAAAERDAWQRPEEVMDGLGLRAGSAVADVGCGEG